MRRAAFFSRFVKSRAAMAAVLAAAMAIGVAASQPAGAGELRHLKPSGKLHSLSRKMHHLKSSGSHAYSGYWRSGTKRHRFSHHDGMRTLAGRTVPQIASGRLGSSHRDYHRGGHRYRYHANGLLIITDAPQGSQKGMTEVAGGSEDCAYGTYCTIDLGGPKIITFNDVADIKDGEVIGQPENEVHLDK